MGPGARCTNRVVPLQQDGVEGRDVIILYDTKNEEAGPEPGSSAAAAVHRSRLHNVDMTLPMLKVPRQHVSAASHDLSYLAVIRVWCA